ncbi:MAG: RagB/SusD family nutrient uptake outer membrane protein [Dysgonamonadaceae bacterium]|jgi:hypothetical protein|nr:RagB/SusD family nutrient uptake outer membrane protein [Dysgonamonadaceae bacterium]
MKKIVKNILLAGLAVFVSCSDYFESIPADSMDLDMVFSNRGLAAKWLSNVYSYLPDETSQNYTGGDNETRGIWTPASIEGKLPWDHCNSNLLTGGTFYSSTGYVTNMWKAYYRGIQKANIYIANIDRCTDMNLTDRSRSKAEAKALRSIFYFNLFKIYGPFIIVGDEVYDSQLPGGSVKLLRSSVDECVEYMVQEFDNLLESGDLVSQFSDKTGDGYLEFDEEFAGNITRETVEAVRSQVLLYAASYLFNGHPYYKDMKDENGKSLFPQSRDQQKWEKARKAAKDFIDNNPNFQLVMRFLNSYGVDPLASCCPYLSVYESALGRRTNEEMIFFRTRGDWNIYYTMTPRHAGIQDAQTGGGALCAPLQMVDLYFTDKGLRIEDDPDYFNYTNEEEDKFTTRSMTSSEQCKDRLSGYVYFTPGTGRRIMKQFYNREARFYAAFTFQNLQWIFDTSKAYYTDFALNGNSGRAKNGHDYPKSGMLARKKMRTGDVPYYIYIRLSEIYLNYAEASNECGDIAEAIKYINIIRARAGVAEYKGLGADATPLDRRGQERIEIPLTYESVTNVLRRERLLELAYENQHYFDVRRWGVAGMEQGDGWVYPSWHLGGEGGDMLGFDVEVDMESPDINPMLFYRKVVWEKRIFSQRMLLFPVPQTEINIDPSIVQNTGWGSVN